MTTLIGVLPHVSIILLSAVLPLGVFIARSNIRASRYEIINDLERLFGFATDDEGDPLILPSFEARFYFVPVFSFIVLSASGFALAFLKVDEFAGVAGSAFVLGAIAGRAAIGA
jgi:hypothetical protein